MAPFNPAISPTNDPNYLHYSKPIEKPELIPDKSTGTLLSGLGESLTTGVTGADETLKRMISEKEHSEWDPIQEAHIKALSEKYNQIKNTPGASNQDVASNDDPLLANAQETVPEALGGLGNKVDTLAAARASGKYTNTLLDAQAYALATKLRTQYPGYRDYIDQKMSKYTGGDPANKLITSLTADINSYVQNANAQKNKTESMLIHAVNKGYEGADQVLNAHRAGILSDNKAVEYVAQNAQQEYKFHLDALKRADVKGNRELTETLAADEATNRVVAKVGNLFGTMELVGTGGNPQKITDMLEQAASGKTPIDDAKNAQMIQVLQAQRARIFNSQMSEFNKIDPNTKRSLTNDLKGGLTEAKTLINNGLEQFDQIIDLYKNKEYGAAFTAQRQVEAMSSNSQYSLSKDPKVGPPLQMIQNIQKMGGPQAASLYMTQLLAGPTDESGRNFAKDLKEYTNNQAMRISTQQGAEQTGRTVTVYDTMRTMQDKGIKEPLAYKKIMDLQKWITDPKASDEFKVNHAKAFFADTRLLASNLIKDPEKLKVFQGLTSEAVTQEMARLSKTTPGLWNTYQNWAEKTFKVELFGKEINNLNLIQDTPNLKMGYDSDKVQFKVMPDSKGGSMSNNANIRIYQAQAEQSINRLNSGLSNLANISKAAGVDPNVYILSLLSGSGWKPGTASEKMLRAFSGVLKPKDKEGGLK